MDEKVIAEIKQRQRKLKEAGKQLKAHFVGLDDIIDNILKAIETWYVMPNLLSRPAIICLWGPTGVGKTDLVRRLVKHLHVQDKFCEVTLSNKGNGTYPWAASIGSVLRNSNIQSGVPSVILLDEIQGFRTVDEDGNDIHDCKFKDVWTLLSDGKLPYHVEIENLMSMLWDIQKKEIAPGKATTSRRRHLSASSILDAADDDDEEENGANGDVTVSVPMDGDQFDFYQLNYFKSLLRLDEPIEEIALWPESKRKTIIMQRLVDKTIFEEEDYTKCLIFISGNIDEAYGFAKETKEVDADADILHEMSKKISILDIKEALVSRFKPEQISRMGNAHVIYPSLSKQSFRTIIERKIDAVSQRVKEQTDIELVVDHSIHQLIYNNGVFPTQGTRPVFSTISDILENSLPNFLLKAILKGAPKMHIEYRDNAIRAAFGEASAIRRYVGTLDKLKNERRQNMDRRALTAVHEAGHAVTFALLFNISPTQIVGSPASNDSEGFIYTVQSCTSRDMARRRLCVMLAGQAAEKIVFGKDNVTGGSGSDLVKATQKAAQMVRKWGMENYSSVIARQDDDIANNDQSGSNAMIEAIVQDCKKQVEELLLQHIDIFEDTVDKLMVADAIAPSEFRAIFKKHGVVIGAPRSSEETIYWQYFDQYQKFKTTRKSS